MQTRLNPYINFKGNARQAMEFYKTVFGGKLVMTTFGEAHLAQDPSENEAIMHAQLQTESGLCLMASDTPAGMELTPGTNISISLSGDNEAELQGYWDKLVVGSTVRMPLAKSPWNDLFGMLTDQFGVLWMVNISAPTDHS